MAKAPSEMKSQIVRPAPETPEASQVRESRASERAPSDTVRTLSGADSKARAVDYRQEYVENDFTRITTDSGKTEVRILASQYTEERADPERDRKDAIAAATTAQFRRFQVGGQSQVIETSRPSDSPAESEADAGHEAFKQGLMRGRFRV